MVGFYERFKHATLAWNADDDKGSLRYRGFNCGGEVCPLCVLKDWAKKMIEADPLIRNDIVLSAEKKGKDDIDLSMGDLAGEGDWRTKVTDTKKEYAVCWVPHEDIESDAPYKVLDMVPGLFFSIQEIIKSRIEDEGEENGNPLMSPWAMKLVYDKDAKNPTDYYKATPVAERSYPYDETVGEVLETEPPKDDIDLDRLTAESYYGDQLEALGLAWYKHAPHSFDEFVEFFEDGADKNAMKAADELKDSQKSNKDVKKGAKKSTKSKNAKKSILKNAKSGNRKKDDEDPDERTCDECGEVVGDSKFCPGCGSSVRRSKVKNESNKEEVICEDCGRRVVPTKRGRCPKCGMTLDVPI